MIGEFKISRIRVPSTRSARFHFLLPIGRPPDPMVWVEFASSSTCLESRLFTLDFETEVLEVVRNLRLGIIGTGLAVGINCLGAKLSALARRLHIL
jgi:hypothetical protein